MAWRRLMRKPMGERPCAKVCWREHVVLSSIVRITPMTGLVYELERLPEAHLRKTPEFVPEYGGCLGSVLVTV